MCSPRIASPGSSSLSSSSTNASIARQRRRILGALAESLAGPGYAEGSIDEIVARAHVSRQTFYSCFEGRAACLRAACLRAAYEDAEHRLWRSAAAAAQGGSEWARQLAAAFAAVLGFFAAEPGAIHLFGLEAELAEPQIAVRRRELNARLAGLLRRGRAAAPAAADLPEGTEAALIDQVSTLLQGYALRGECGRLPSLAPELTALLLTPYLGAERAREVAAERA